MNKLGFIFIILSSLFSSSSWGQEITLPSGIKISESQIKSISEGLPKLQEEKVFYHWTKQETGLRWISQGYVNEGEVRFYNQPSGQLQVYGPGVYLAESPTSSKNFGELPVAFKIKKGTPIYDDKLVQKILGKSLSHADRSFLGEHIPFVRNVSGDWYVTNSPQNTNDLIYARAITPEAKVYVKDPENWTPFNTKAFSELIQQGDQDALYLKKILALSDYMDGIGFSRAMVVNPGSPWSEFNPEHFDQYQRALDELPEKTKSFFKNHPKGVAKETLTELLPVVYGSLSGEGTKKLEDIVRTEGVRAGGEDPGNTFLAGQDEVFELKKNPYLTVEALDQGNLNYLVHYFYPDALHFEHLKEKISPNLLKKLLSYSSEELMSNHKLRQSLNKELILELMADLGKNSAGKGSRELVKDLVSIHPFGDYNGRSMRMIEKLLAYNGGSVGLGGTLRNRHYFISDLDLLVSTEKESALLKKSSEAHLKLQQDLLEEFLLAKSERRMPDYLKTGALEKYAEASMPDEMILDLRNHDQLEMVRRRQWDQLFDSAGDLYWGQLENLLLSEPTRAKALEKIYTSKKFIKASNFSLEGKKILLTGLHGKFQSASPKSQAGARLRGQYLKVLSEIPLNEVPKDLPTKRATLESLSKVISNTEVSVKERVFKGLSEFLSADYESASFVFKNFVQMQSGSSVSDEALVWLKKSVDPLIHDTKAFTGLSTLEQQKALNSLKEIENYFKISHDTHGASLFDGLHSKLSPLSKNCVQQGIRALMQDVVN